MDIQFNNNSSNSSRPERIKETRRERLKREKRENKGEDKRMFLHLYYQKENLTNYLLQLSNAVSEQNRGKAFDAIDSILRVIKSKRSLVTQDESEYAMSKIYDALVEIYKNEIIRQYESIKYNEMYFSKVPHNFSEDIYKYDYEARCKANARAILDDKYKTAIYGGFMHVVIGRILNEHEENKNKNSVIKKPQRTITATKPVVDKGKYIEKMKAEISKIFGPEDR